MVQTCMKRPQVNTVSGLSGPVHGSLVSALDLVALWLGCVPSPSGCGAVSKNPVVEMEIMLSSFFSVSYCMGSTLGLHDILYIENISSSQYQLCSNSADLSLSLLVDVSDLLQFKS